MNLILYKNKSDAKTVNKNIEQIADLICTVYNDCSILSPVMLLKYARYIADCNYAYIPDFNRYYFTGNPTLLNGGRCILPMHVDPLMSHKDEIKRLYCNISRCESVGITMMPDANIGVNGNIVNIYDFPSEFEDTLGQYSYVLAVLGGKYNAS